MRPTRGREDAKETTEEAKASDDFEELAHQSFILSICRRS